MPNQKKQLSVFEFMRKHAKKHSDMTYDVSRRGFILDKCSDTSTGIYFIVRMDTHDILKIGKAEGKYGLKGRIQTYRSNLSKRTGDHTVKRYYDVMTGPLEGVMLEMRILPLPIETKNILGYEVEMQVARSLELLLSKQAKEERHTMSLSGQD